MASDDDHGPDPTAGHASSGLTSLIDPRADKAIWSAVVFVLLFGGLYVLAWKPIQDGLHLREQTIAQQIADAKAASESAAAKLKEYETKLTEAAVQAQGMVAQARKDAESAAERIKAEGQAEATRQRDRALAEIETAKQSALSELTSKSTDLAFVLARRIVGRELRKEDHQQLLTDAISKLPSRN